MTDSAARNHLEDHAVFPVLGVVLVVGVTVVPVGITGSFLLGFAATRRQSPQAGVSYDGSITLVASGNADGVVVVGDGGAVVLGTVGDFTPADEGDVVLVHVGAVCEPKSAENVNAQTDAVAVVRRL